MTTCPRCAGLLTLDWAYDPGANVDGIELVKCINCGYCEDAVIVEHRDHPLTVPIEKKWRRKHRRLTAIA